MALSQSARKARAASWPTVCWARWRRSLISRPNSCRLPTARAGSAALKECENSAPNSDRRDLAANSPSAASVWWPMPRLGVVTARRKAGSSSSLIHRRSQAHRSLISARSKKLCPPDTLYGICARRSACSKTRAWWLARYRMAKSRHSLCGEVWRRLWMRATARSASCASWSQSTTRTGSPSPSSEYSVFGNSLGFGPMTLLAARRIAPVER